MLTPRPRALYTPRLYNSHTHAQSFCMPRHVIHALKQVVGVVGYTALRGSAANSGGLGGACVRAWLAAHVLVVLLVWVLLVLVHHRLGPLLYSNG